jgi:Tol biopolymer transport system component
MLTMVGAIASTTLGAPSSEPTDTIVYEHAPDALAPWPVLDIYSLDTESGKSRALTNDGHSHTPSWSSDGLRILFIHDAALRGKASETADTESHYPLERCVMNRDGSNPRLLRRLETAILQAVWSPDNKSIAATYSPREWERTAKQGNPPSPPVTGLFLIPLDERSEPRLLFKEGFTPAWSPDGRHIAFDALVDGHEKISTMDENGSRQRQLTTDLDWDCSAPSWSPDGERIAFYCTAVSSPCRAGSAGPDSSENKCVRRVFVTRAFDPSATPLQLTKEDGASPVFAPKR